MANERETVSLQGMIRWALAECAAREIDALPDIQELNALYPDTAAFRRRVFSAIGKWKKQEKRRPLRVLKHIIVAAAVLISVLFGQCVGPYCGGQYDYRMDGTIDRDSISSGGRDVGGSARGVWAALYSGRVDVSGGIVLADRSRFFLWL